MRVNTEFAIAWCACAEQLWPRRNTSAIGVAHVNFA